MLANGIKLAFSKTKGDYQNLVGLKEVPEFGIEPEKSREYDSCRQG